MQPRLRAELWVRAYLKRLELNNIPAFIAARGQPDSGAVMVKCATLDGLAKLYTRTFDYEADCDIWTVLTEGPEGFYVNNGDWVKMRTAVWIRPDAPPRLVDCAQEGFPWLSNT